MASGGATVWSIPEAEEDEDGDGGESQATPLEELFSFQCSKRPLR